jgi:hypothetical protein
MSFIDISKTKKLNVDSIDTYDISTHEVTDENLEQVGRSDAHRVIGRTKRQETVLRITTKDGDSYVLYGVEADNAVLVLGRPKSP